jgi:hypothetical protein
VSTLRALGGIAVSGSAAVVPTARAIASFNNLIRAIVRASKECLGYFDRKRPGRPQIQDQLHFDRLLDRQVRGLVTVQNSTGVDTPLLRAVVA